MDIPADRMEFDDKGLIPAVVQDYATSQVLMMAYMNKQAFEKSVSTGLAHFWSRSRNSLWLKGETSGNYQHIKEMSLDCDGDTLLIKVEQDGAACHTGHYSCFYRTLQDGVLKETSAPVFDPDKMYGNKAQILQDVYDVIADRMNNPKEGSYTNYLFEKGLDKILKKVGEETAEVIIAAKNKAPDEIRYEVADLFYHIMVMLAERGMSLDDIYDELRKRR